MSEKPPFELTPEQLHDIVERHEHPWDIRWDRKQVTETIRERVLAHEAQIEAMQDAIAAAKKVLEAFERYQWHWLSDSALRYLTWEMIRQAQAERRAGKT